MIMNIGVDELSYITPRWLEEAPSKVSGTVISLPFRSELAGDEDFLMRLQRAVDPLVLLGLRRLRRLSLAVEGEERLSARLTRSSEEDFLEVKTWRACLRVNETAARRRAVGRAPEDHFFRVFSSKEWVCT